MSDMKCPFCGEKLQQTYSFNPKQFWCSNYYDHKHPINLQGTKELWQELIRTRKALEIAVDALDAGRTLARIAGFEMLATGMDEALNKIKALEQKDN